MIEAFISEVQIFAFPFQPKGWAFCNGQTMNVSQNQALFSLIGTTYGGNGTTTFMLPNLQGRAAAHIGNAFSQGQVGGEETHALTIAEMPTHSHQVVASSNAPGASGPANNFFATGTGFSPYGTTVNEQMAPQAIASTGTNTPHENRSPYLVVNFCICLQGIFPSRN